MWRLQKLRCLRYIRYEHPRFLPVLFLIVCAVILAEMYREQHSFCVTHYEVHSPKITCTAEKDPVNRIIFLSDMHNHVYGKQNNKLFEAIKAEQPDLILIGGDMLVAKNDVRYQEALDFVSRLPQLCPVYYASGNHEQRIKENQENYSLCYEEYRKKLQAEGFVFWKMKVAIFCWEINRFISADWNSH